MTTLDLNPKKRQLSHELTGPQALRAASLGRSLGLCDLTALHRLSRTCWTSCALLRDAQAAITSLEATSWHVTQQLSANTFKPPGQLGFHSDHSHHSDDNARMLVARHIVYRISAGISVYEHAARNLNAHARSGVPYATAHHRCPAGLQ
jgi:hypothetical protein